MESNIKSFQDFSEYQAGIDTKKLEEEKSAKQEEYTKFFNAKLKKYDVTSPSELDDEKKKKFFDEIEKGWTKDKNE